MRPCPGAHPVRDGSSPGVQAAVAAAADADVSSASSTLLAAQMLGTPGQHQQSTPPRMAQSPGSPSLVEPVHLARAVSTQPVLQ
eukprot:5777407-Amphidinium_carterae.1